MKKSSWKMKRCQSSPAPSTSCSKAFDSITDVVKMFLNSFILAWRAYRLETRFTTLSSHLLPRLTYKYFQNHTSCSLIHTSVLILLMHTPEAPNLQSNSQMQTPETGNIDVLHSQVLLQSYSKSISLCNSDWVQGCWVAFGRFILI